MTTMNPVEKAEGAAPAPSPTPIVVAATFTAEPMGPALEFWTQELGLGRAIEFAPYNQVFQELLDPSSASSRNRSGANVFLIRVEDWLRDASGEHQLERNANELIDAMRTAATRSKAPHIVAVCPPSPAAAVNPAIVAAGARILTELADAAGVVLISPDDIPPRPAGDYHDPRRDALGHIPYTSLFFAALATLIARRLHAVKTSPYKVVAFDCDNTLWKGVVGEDGPEGLLMTPGFLEIQQFAVDLTTRGFLLCLCSKNEEQDVLEAFNQRNDMPLRPEHLVGHRINWTPKSENLRSLAKELNLGLDSFVFIDDNPVECAEVRANCPEVAVIPMESDEGVGHVLQNLWPFDRLKVTSEDRRRTDMYRQNSERTKLKEGSRSFADFLADLGLDVAISEPKPDRIDRTAQLTQRTNQFNFTTIRRDAADVASLAAEGKQTLCIDVRDRFGDYGLVGVIIYGPGAEALNVDTFLLSCRVLGRGVEHRMLNELAVRARDLGLSRVDATLTPTRKNLPARKFLDSVAAEYRSQEGDGFIYRIPLDVALAAAPDPGSSPEDEAEETAGAATPTHKALAYHRIASALGTPELVLAAIEAAAGMKRPRPTSVKPFRMPSTPIEARLASIWAEVLRYQEIGVDDDYFQLGGTSLASVDLLGRVHEAFGAKLPLTALIQGPTVARMAAMIDEPGRRDSLVFIREGTGAPPLFLIHDGDGETLLYRGLALLLDSRHDVYGLQPRSDAQNPILHATIEDMAGHHIAKIRSVQPHGPYLLGGMCAGGVIAFETARQLEEAGETVALVALLDSADVEARLRPWRGASNRLRSFSAGLAEADATSLIQRAVTIAAKATRKIQNTVLYESRTRLKRLIDRARMRLLSSYLRRNRPAPAFLSGADVRMVYLYAECNYRPSGPVRAPLVVIRATHGDGSADEAYIDRYEDPMLGWTNRSTGGVEAIDVPGGHSSMLQEPHVRVMAEQLQKRLDKALAETSP